MLTLVHTRNLRTLTVLFAVQSILVGKMSVAGASWEEEKVTDDGIVVHSRTTEGTTVREVRARMLIDAPTDIVFEVVCDPKTFKDTTKKYVEKNLFYHTSDPNVWYNYQLLDLPVIANRDYCLKYEKTADIEKGRYLISWRASNRFGPPPQEDVVRVSRIKGSIEVSPDRNGNGSIVRYTLLADPGGNIPAWLINFANRRSLPNILRQIKDAALEPKKK